MAGAGAAVIMPHYVIKSDMGVFTTEETEVVEADNADLAYNAVFEYIISSISVWCVGEYATAEEAEAAAED